METAEATDEYNGEITQAEINDLISKAMLLGEVMSGSKFWNYQKPYFSRLMESLLLGEGAELSLLATRQSGKTRTTGVAFAVAMVLLPALAKVDRYADLLQRYATGVMIGLFAPTDEQAKTVHANVANMLTSKTAEPILEEFGVEVPGKLRRGLGTEFTPSNGSLCRRQTAAPKANIEGKSYHVVMVDEAQDVEAQVITKSILPMLTMYNGTTVFTGTPTYTKGYFYNAIATNKRLQLRKGSRQLHYEVHWTEAAREVEDYRKYVEKQKLRLGEDSDSFRISYCLYWPLEKGMFVPMGRLDHRDERFCGDVTMRTLAEYHKTPIVLGIDPARTVDSTVVTALWVNWDRVDMFGMRECRIINWLEINNVEWEQQYFQIMEFASRFDVRRACVDATGMGSAVAERLQVLMGYRTEVIAESSDLVTQAKRWKLLLQMLERRTISWPAHPSTRTGKKYRKFETQMGDLEKKYVNGSLIAEAPNVAGAHDDFCDSAALAVSAAIGEPMPQVVSTSNPFAASRSRHAR